MSKVNEPRQGHTGVPTPTSIKGTGRRSVKESEPRQGLVLRPDSVSSLGKTKFSTELDTDDAHLEIDCNEK